MIRPVQRSLTGWHALKLLLSCRLQDLQLKSNAHNADLVHSATFHSKVDGPLEGPHATDQQILSLDGCDQADATAVARLRFRGLHATTAVILTTNEPVPWHAQLPRFTRTSMRQNVPMKHRTCRAECISHPSEILHVTAFCVASKKVIGRC